jgi:tetratricopeptide (TPR) repeat protein
MQLSPHNPAQEPALYFAKAIAFSQLQDNEQALLWIERAEASAPEFLVAGLVRSVLLELAGREDEAHATMQRYLANDKAPFRTMSEWRARWAGLPLQSWSPRFLFWGKISQMASGKLGCRSKQAVCPRRRGDRNSGSLHVSYGSNAEELSASKYLPGYSSKMG